MAKMNDQDFLQCLDTIRTAADQILEALDPSVADGHLDKIKNAWNLISEGERANEAVGIFSRESQAELREAIKKMSEKYSLMNPKRWSK